LTHCDPRDENSAFFVIAGLPTQGPLKRGQPNFANVRGLKGLVTVKILGKFVLNFFILSAYMKEQPWDLNQTWPVGWKWCRFINAPEKFMGLFYQNLGCKKHQILDHFSATSTLETAHL